MKQFPYVLLTAAFALAGSAAYYSVFGIGKLFSSQFLAVTILAGCLEASKLITASYLHRKWSEIGKFVRVYLTAAVVTLMLITSMGIYGFLASAYQDTARKLDAENMQLELLASKRTQYQTQIAAIRRDKQSLGNNIQTLTKALSNNRIRYTDAKGNQVLNTSSENRKAYETQLAYSTTRLDNISQKESQLMDSISSFELQSIEIKNNSEVAAEIGPLKYLAEITGKPMDVVANWLILALIFVFDPLAIMLLISANKELNAKTKEPEPKLEINPEIVMPEVEAQPVKQEILSYWNKLRNQI